MRALTVDELESISGGLAQVQITGTRPQPSGPTPPLLSSPASIVWDGATNAGFDSQSMQLQTYRDWMDAGYPSIDDVQPLTPNEEQLVEVKVTSTRVPRESSAQIPMLPFSADDWLSKFAGAVENISTEYDEIETVTINGHAYHVAASIIFGHEGLLKLSPTAPKGENHLTVGNGFDLTKHNEAELKNMGFPKALIEKLSPYLGKTSDATDLPKDLLKLSIEDATLISKLKLASIIRAVEETYEEKSNRQFEDLPANVQTVAVDLAYMMGPNGFPRFMGNLVNFDPTKPDYTDMKNELINFWGKDANSENINGLRNRTNDDLRILIPPKN